MAVIQITPSDRDAWLQARKQDVTASVAACLFRDDAGISAHPFTTAYKLWKEKTGAGSNENFNSPVLERGVFLEPPTFDKLAKDHPDWSVHYPLGNRYYRDPDLRIGATPDGFARRPGNDGFGVVQAKSADEFTFKRKWLDDETGDVVVPLWIAVQAIVEARMVGASWACVALIVVGVGVQLHVIDIPLHDALFDALVVLVRDFWRMVEAGEVPPPDWDRDGDSILDVYRNSAPTKVDLSSDPTFDALAARLAVVREDRIRLSKQESNLKAQLIFMMGNNEVATGDRFIASAPTRTRKPFVVDETQSRSLKIKER